MRIQSTLFSFFCLPILSLAKPSDQVPIMPVGPSGPTNADYVPRKHTKPSLADLLTIERSASIFYTYARELEISSKFADEDSRLTLFVPTNKAVMALSRKPNQGTKSNEDGGLSQSQFDKKAKKNVERWVSGHLIPEFPLTFDCRPHKTLLNGKSISFNRIPNNKDASPEWKSVTLDNGAKVIGKKEGSNGDLYLIDVAISPD